MKYIILILTLVLLISCSDEKEVERNKFLDIVLIDTFDNELIFDTTSHIEKTIYHPSYYYTFLKNQDKDTFTKLLKFSKRGYDSPLNLKCIVLW